MSCNTLIRPTLSGLVAGLLAACASPPATEAPAPEPTVTTNPAPETPSPARSPETILQTPPSDRHSNELVLVAVGDVSQPAGQWPAVTERLGERVLDPTRPLLVSGDLAFMNLETPVTDAEATADKPFAFTTPPERLGWYLDAGFNLFSLANNHIADAGESGIQNTIEAIESEAATRSATVHHAGAGRSGPDRLEPVPVSLPDKDLDLAFFSVGFSDSPSVIHWQSHELPRAIRAAAESKSFDQVVVSVHAGVEYRHVPVASVRSAFRGYVDAGADLVLGHHPHVIQPVECHDGGLIAYSLGNFVFASRTLRHRENDARLYGMLTRIVFRDRELLGAEIVPLWVNNTEGWTLPDGHHLPRTDFTPRPLSGAFADAFFDDLADWSRAIDAEPARRYGDRGWITADCDG